MAQQLFVLNEPFGLESGAVLPRLELAYHTYGTHDREAGNVIWICHALTGNSEPVVWWHGLVGPGKLFDPEQYFIVCANQLGSCYGSSGPMSINPETGKPYYRSFPMATVRDTVRAMTLLRRHLNIPKIRLIIGGSMGGQQVLEWAVQEPDVIDMIAPISTNVHHSPWGIGLNEAQRLAIEADPTWQDERSEAGQAGLKAARAIGMLSYRNYETMLSTQLDSEEKLDGYRASTYLQHQGDKLVRRFNAQAYWLLTKAMDSHALGRDRGGDIAALKSIRARALVVGVSSDILFPVEEQRFLAEHIPNAVYREIESSYGHDGFLIEYEKLTELLTQFINAEEKVGQTG